MEHRGAVFTLGADDFGLSPGDYIPDVGFDDSVQALDDVFLVGLSFGEEFFFAALYLGGYQGVTQESRRGGSS